MTTYDKADLQRFSPGVRCSARSVRTGEQCKRWASRGAQVCTTHGGSAPQVKAAARKRLDQAADVLVQRLLGFALDGQCEDNTALRAIIAALDRAGIIVPNTLDVTVGPKPWEQIFDGISGGSRAAARASSGYPDPLALDAGTRDDDPGEIVDAELVEQEPDPGGSDSDCGTPDAPRNQDQGTDGAGTPDETAKDDRRRPQAHVGGLEVVRHVNALNARMGVYDQPRALGPGRR